eukprot:Clim_evm9s221 gene=Clim_evmTU9s221
MKSTENPAGLPLQLAELADTFHSKPTTMASLDTVDTVIQQRQVVGLIRAMRMLREDYSQWEERIKVTLQQAANWNELNQALGDKASQRELDSRALEADERIDWLWEEKASKSEVRALREDLGSLKAHVELQTTIGDHRRTQNTDPPDHRDISPPVVFETLRREVSMLQKEVKTLREDFVDQIMNKKYRQAQAMTAEELRNFSTPHDALSVSLNLQGQELAHLRARVEDFEAYKQSDAVNTHGMSQLTFQRQVLGRLNDLEQFAEKQWRVVQMLKAQQHAKEMKEQEISQEMERIENAMKHLKATSERQIGILRGSIRNMAALSL